MSIFNDLPNKWLGLEKVRNPNAWHKWNSALSVRRDDCTMSSELDILGDAI